MPTAPRRAPAPRSLYGALLRLWRLAPLPDWLRGLILWCSHQRYLIGAVGLIWDEQGRLLLARHTYLPPPGWSLPGGWLRRGETLEAGVARELAEELGLVVDVGPLVAWAELTPPRHYTFGFVCWVRAGAFQPNAEVVEIAYFPPDEAARLVPADVRPLIEMAVRHRARLNGQPPPA